MAFAAAAPSASAERVTVPVRVTGTLAVTWHGDAARGCQAGMECDADGLLTYRPDFSGTVDFAREGGRLRPTGGGGASDTGTAIVRVHRHDARPRSGVCTDHLPLGFAEVELTDLGPRARLSLLRSDVTLTSGRCAGPAAPDLARALPALRVDLSRVRSRPVRLDLSGRRALAAGPYSGEIVSTIHVRIGRSRPSSLGLGSSSPEFGPTGGLEVLQVSYRVVRLQARVGLSFAALAGPDCELLDACGLSGTADYSLNARRGTVQVYAERALAPGERPSLARALRALRQGRTRFEATGLPVPGRPGSTSTELRRDGTVTCIDTLAHPGPAIDLTSAGRMAVADLTFGGGVDPFRGRCPGPDLGDVLSETPVALGRVRVADLLRRTLVVRLHGRARFARLGYGGSQEAAGVLELRRSRVRLITPGGGS